MQREIYLCIGGNIGERDANLEETLDFINFNLGDIKQVSSVYESEPWGMIDVPNFLNQVVLVVSQLTNEELLQEIYELEEFYGRERGTEGYVSREMDIDVLFVGNEVIATEKLQVPHPRMQERRFVLEPMAEMAAEFIHPVLQLSIAELLKECKDQGKVSRV